MATEAHHHWLDCKDIVTMKGVDRVQVNFRLTVTQARWLGDLLCDVGDDAERWQDQVIAMNLNARLWAATEEAKREVSE